jgi:hypothetical protein
MNFYKLTRRCVAAMACALALYIIAVPCSAKPETEPEAIKLVSRSNATLDVKAFWEPITSSGSGFGQAWSELRDFRPAVEVRRYSTQDFAALLPNRDVRVGDTWQIDKERCLKFLKQFHDGATSVSHFDNGDSPEHGLATLARYNDQLAVILARFHAVFVLKEGWLTPGQFQGTLVVDRRSGAVTFFRFKVPLSPVNFDANWKILDGEVNGQRIDPNNPPIATDSGVIPRMELIGGEKLTVEDQEWTESMSDEAAWSKIEKELYPFRQIDWVEFEHALAAARQTGKPLHVVTIDGTLCDESCCGSGKALRAGPLSDKRIAQLVNAKCINTWVLNKRLPSLRDNAEDSEAQALAFAILAGRQPHSPVDSMVLTPDLRLISVQAANDILGQPREALLKTYEEFLTVAFEKLGKE